MSACLCGSTLAAAECCDRFISGAAIPSTPEELMRSRYTAYATANIPYIEDTMKSPANDHFDAAGARDWATRMEWLRLEILNSSQQDNTGTVEFIVHLLQNKQRHVLHEVSEFRRDDGKWFYIDGKDPGKQAVLPIRIQHIGRNEACLCGSGKKYKKCCGHHAVIS